MPQHPQAALAIRHAGGSPIDLPPGMIHPFITPGGNVADAARAESSIAKGKLS